MRETVLTEHSKQQEQLADIVAALGADFTVLPLADGKSVRVRYEREGVAVEKVIAVKALKRELGMA